MKVIAKTIKNDVATVYIAKKNDNLIEFVESIQPPLSLTDKWVLIISSMVGCPVNCKMCDAGGEYKRKLSKDELLFQIDYMVKKRFPTMEIPVNKFKIQFARVGEPTFNPAVLEVLEELPRRYDAPGLIPAISTIAPHGSDAFLNKLMNLKNRFYRDGKFQLQFSIHSTDLRIRDKITPIKKWDFAKIAEFGENFYFVDDRKITLNFALANDFPLEVDVLKKYFDPNKFIIKITPINPTITATKNNLTSFIKNDSYSNIESVSSEYKKQIMKLL